MGCKSRKLNLRHSAIGAAALLLCGVSTAAPLTLSGNPLFLTSNATPNVLVLYGNANSMDEAANGAAVGSSSSQSKSEISRVAIKGMIASYQNTINMGLMAYQQDNADLYSLGNSQYDVSYDPADYDPAYSGPRNGTKKRFRVPNPTDSGKYIYYNVGLPFYSEDDIENWFMYSGTACTSPRSDFYGTYGSACYSRETVVNPMNRDPAGPWDTYQIWKKKTGTSNASPGSNGAGYSDKLTDSSFYPTTSDLAQGITDFGVRNAIQYVGRSWFANTSPGRGFVHRPIAKLDAVQTTALNKKLATAQFNSKQPTDPAYPLQNSGLTPIEGAVMTANDYYNGNLAANSPTTRAQGGPLPVPPESCGKNFLVMLTDGLPSVTKDGAPSADVDVNLANVSTQVRALLTSRAQVRTYEVGFALPYGVNPAQLDTIAAAGGTGSAYYATDPASLNVAFRDVFADILARTSSSASLAANSTSLNNGTTIFQARFNSADWTGELSAFPVDAAGQVGRTPAWNASTSLDAMDPGSRVILTYDYRFFSPNGGIPFRWNSLPSTYQDALRTNDNGTSGSVASGQARLEWFRGDNTNEGTTAGNLRKRNSDLGDIVNSNPVYVGGPSAGWADSDYATFAATYRARKKVVYVGSNDGMLHGFDATNGQEVIAYIPGSVIASPSTPSAVPSNNMAHLSTQPYATHRYYVDGSPITSDAKFGSPAKWGTILVGGLGAGGRGIYALDVTDPSRFTEGHADDLVQWEFNSDLDPDVGFTFAQPSIVKLANGRWAAMFGNGYNSTDNKAYLYLVFLDRAPGSKLWLPGVHYIKIPTGAGDASLPNGLSTPVATDVDADGIVDYVYAGDLQGNMWKFDLRDTSATRWGNPFGNGIPFFTAQGPGNTVQPISSAPEVVRNPAGGYSVLFGTGLYLQSGTIDTGNRDVQTFYGILDREGAEPIGLGRTRLQQQSILAEVTAGDSRYRITSANAVDYAAKQGWFMDLAAPPSTTPVGERAVYRPIARNGRIIFTTLTPSAAACEYGGNSWLMELDAFTGSRLTSSPFDVNGDGTFTKTDFLTWGVVSVPVSGRSSTIGITPTPTVIQNPATPNKEYKVFSGTSGNTESVSENASGSSGRLSWRQIMH
jgi:type IV pilus assembly protein PilY1